jgi:hypothetical protein
MASSSAPGAGAVMAELIVNGGSQTRVGELAVERFRGSPLHAWRAHSVPVVTCADSGGRKRQPVRDRSIKIHVISKL